MVAWAVSLGTVFLGPKPPARLPRPLTTKPKTPTNPRHHDLGHGMLAAGSVILGIAPSWPSTALLNPILGALGLGAGVHVTWFGLSAMPAASPPRWTRPPLVSLVLGGAIYAVAYAAVRRKRSSSSGRSAAGIFTGGEPLSDQGRLTAGDFSEIFLEHWQSFFRWSNVDRVYLRIWDGFASRFTRARCGWWPCSNARLCCSSAVCGAGFCVRQWIMLHLRRVYRRQAAYASLLIAAVGVAASALLAAALVSGAKH